MPLSEVSVVIARPPAVHARAFQYSGSGQSSGFEKPCNGQPGPPLPAPGGWEGLGLTEAMRGRH